MTGADLRAIRKSLGLGVVEFGRALGYVDGTDNSTSVVIRGMESGHRTITTTVARLAFMYHRHGVPPAALHITGAQPVKTAANRRR